MTLLQIAVGVLAATFIVAFLGAVAGLFQDDGYHPMSPDEEYRWLTEEHGLTHEEAEEIMRPFHPPERN